MEQLTTCPACNGHQHLPFVETAAMMHPHTEERFQFVRCNDCGLVFLNPRVPASGLGQYYTAAYLPYRVEEAWGKYAHFVQSDQRRIDRNRVALVKKFHALTPSSRVLDVGCGKPTFLAALRDAVPAQLLGIDFSDEGWASSPDLYQGIQLRKGEVTDLRNEPPLDVVTMWHYLEHDYAPQAHLRQLLDLSHPQTRLIVEVPNHDSYTRRRFGAHWAGYHTPRHTALYSPDSIRILMENSGWQVEQVLTYGTLDPYTLHWMSRMEQQGIDWTSSMEGRFWGYVAGMVLNAPRYLLHKHQSLGFMTVVAKPI